MIHTNGEYLLFVAHIGYLDNEQLGLRHGHSANPVTAEADVTKMRRTSSDGGLEGVVLSIPGFTTLNVVNYVFELTAGGNE